MQAECIWMCVTPFLGAQREAIRYWVLLKIQPKMCNLSNYAWSSAIESKGNFITDFNSSRNMVFLLMSRSESHKTYGIHCTTDLTLHLEPLPPPLPPSWYFWNSNSATLALHSHHYLHSVSMRLWTDFLWLNMSSDSLPGLLYLLLSTVRLAL